MLNYAFNFNVKHGGIKLPKAPEHPVSMSDFRVLALKNLKHVLAVSPETHEV